MLEPGDETVDMTGSVDKTLLRPTTYTIRATGVGGATAIGSVTVHIRQLNAIHITSPTQGELIKRPDTLVRGTIDNLGGDDIGVVVNGVVANVYDGEFAANHVPLYDNDSVPIIAVAKSTNDYIATDMVTVSAQTTGRNVSLTSKADFGLQPFDITLQLSKCRPNSTYSFSYEPSADAIVNLGDDNASLQFQRRFTQPGLYYITVDNPETLDNGTVVPHSDTVSILVETPQQFNARARGKWAEMTSGLAGATAATFTKNISILSQDKYGAIFNELMPVLSDVAAKLGAYPLELVYVDGTIAKFSIASDEIIDGQPRTATYFIYFIKDMDGLWKIDKY